MSSSAEDISPGPKQQLSLFSLPSQPAEPPGMLTPPLLTSVSVPFQWEEAPGKPRHSVSDNNRNNNKAKKCVRSLDLPPRLLLVSNSSTEVKITNTPSPTTVLDGPEVVRTLSFSYSMRRSSSTKGGGGFGSMRWTTGCKKNNKDAAECSGDPTKVKITRVKRKASFFHGAPHSRSHMWVSIYESLKQVVPWRRRQEKLRKSATVGYEPQVPASPIPTC